MTNLKPNLAQPYAADYIKFTDLFKRTTTTKQATKSTAINGFVVPESNAIPRPHYLIRCLVLCVALLIMFLVWPT